VRQLDSRGRAEGIGWVLAGIGLAAWLLTLRPIHAADLDDLGIIGALPMGTWLAIALVTAAFAFAVELRPMSMRLAIACILGMTVILYGTPAIVEALPRFSTVYVHLGLIEAIERAGRLFPELDARFSWPLFFTGAALISQLAQVDLLTIAQWFPMVTTIAVLPPLWILMRSFVNDRRLSVVALWLFVLADWVAQDYLSPQGMNLVLYVWFIAIVAWLFKRSPRPSAWVSRAMERSRLPRAVFVDSVDRPIGPAISRVGMFAIVVAVAFFSTASHQLTPFAMVGASVGLVIVGRTSLRSLPIMVAVIAALWISFAGQDYLLGNLTQLLKDVGNPTGNAGTSIAGRIRGSEGHLFVVVERIAFTAFFWAVAAVGLWRRIRLGFWDVGAMVLAVVPFAIIGFQSYGGEIFLRVFLFSLPPMAFLAAAAIFPVFYGRSRVQTVVLVLLSVALAVGFVVARYGNERADIVEPGELVATEQAYRLIPQDSLIATMNYNSPIRYRYVELYDHLELQGQLADLTADGVAKELDAARHGQPAFLFLSRGQQALEELLGGATGDWERLTAELDASDRFVPEFQSADAVLYRYVPVEAP
jgi:hypothetical protein